jgi:phosphoglycolate phosphatase-like HAD superfamily hydrolase
VHGDHPVRHEPASYRAVARLVLWDIDGTLVDSAGLGRDAFLEAFEQVTGHAPRRLVPFAGRTDMEIALDLLETAGIDHSERLLGDFEEALAEAMAARAELVRERGRPMPGVRAALERLGEQPGVTQSLLTGNIEPNAEVKLAAFDLHTLLDMEIGAYGSDHRRRGELVAVARRKAKDLRAREFEPREVVLVGDTPLDVAAAFEGGARAVGVATGPYDTRDLRESGAHVVLADLTDLDSVLEAVLG